jgi:hypothetical protein
MSVTEKPKIEPFFLSINETAEALNTCPSQVYVMLGNGSLQAVKDGTRTKVIYESVKQRAATLPKATIKPPKPRRTGAPTP